MRPGISTTLLSTKLYKTPLHISRIVTNKGRGGHWEACGHTVCARSSKIRAISASKYHALKACGGMELELQAFLDSAPGNMSGYLHSSLPKEWSSSVCYSQAIKSKKHYFWRVRTRNYRKWEVDRFIWCLYCHVPWVAWLIITGLELDDWIYWRLLYSHS
jgi:hypothetical protein